MINGFIKAVTRLSQLTGIVAAAMIVLSVLVVCQMVFMRYVLNASTIWQTEFATYLLIGATLIGSPYVLLTRGHVNVDLLPQRVGYPLRLAMALFSTIVATVFCMMLAWYGYHEWYASWEGDWRSEGIWSAPLWVPYFAIPLGFGLLSLQYVADLICLVTGREPPFGIHDEEGE